MVKRTLNVKEYYMSKGRGAISGNTAGDGEGHDVFRGCPLSEASRRAIRESGYRGRF
jgi:hypothetical protein